MIGWLDWCLNVSPLNHQTIYPFILSIWPEANWRRDPFSRSYGAILPSSLERFLSRALVYSTHPPVSVYGTGNWGNNRRLFSAHCPVMRFGQRPKLRLSMT